MKAFDSVDHDYLFQVLKTFKFPTRFIGLIKQFLSIGKSCIKMNDQLSSFFDIYRGVRQDDPLSGPLFVLALEPLLCCLRSHEFDFAPRVGKS